MAGSDQAAAEAVASSINQEQLFHELEQKYLTLRGELAFAETERQTLVKEKNAALEEVHRVQTLATERETELLQVKEDFLKLTSEHDQLGFKWKSTNALAERRLTEIETLQASVKEQASQLVQAQQKEMEAMGRAAEQEAQVAPLNHTIARLQKEISSTHQHTEWLETQLTEKTKAVQTLRRQLAKITHDAEEAKLRSTEEVASMKRQLENARQVSKKLESALIHSKEQVKEIQAAKVNDEEKFQNELNAQRRLAELYKESAGDANARVTELQELCDRLRKSLAQSEEALALETERTKAQVEHLFRQQTEDSEAQMEALRDELKQAQEKIEELEKKKIFSLQTASTIADLSSTAGEAHLAAHGLTPKQMYDHLVEAEEALREERNEKEKLQLYMDRIVKEVQEKAPIIMGLRLDHERAVTSHTQMSERLEVCIQELAKSREKEAHAWKEKTRYEKKCESLAQSVDDLSRQVQHLLFRSQEHRHEYSHPSPGEVVSENLVVFKDIEELQIRNQQLLTVIRELTEMNKQSAASETSDQSSSSTAHLIVSVESDDDTEQSSSSLIHQRLSTARKEIEELRAEREQERQMISAIVKQRDMYRVLLAQSDSKFLDIDDTQPRISRSDGADNLRLGSGSPTARSSGAGRSLNRRGSLDISDARTLRELQAEFDDYKKEKNMNLKLLQESLEKAQTECSQAKLAQMQAQVEASCSKERYEASEARRQDSENELVRLRSKTDQLSALILQHEQLLAASEAKLETATFNAQSLRVEKEAAVREAEYLKKQEDKMQQELTTLRLDNTNLLKLMDSTRRMEATREERDRRDNEALTKKIAMLELTLQETIQKAESKEAIASASLLATEHEKKSALGDLEKVKKTCGAQKEQLIRLEEQKASLESKCSLFEKEVTHLREQLRKGASVAVAERVGSLEVQLQDAQREVQVSLAARKALVDNVSKYKTIAEANEKSLNELSNASEKWKKEQEEKLHALDKERDNIREELTKARAELKEHITEGNKLREEMDRIEHTHKTNLQQALEKQKVLQAEADGARQQLLTVRAEMEQLKADLTQSQQNYERELQLHASEVSKSAASRKLIEDERKAKLELDTQIVELKSKLSVATSESRGEVEKLQKALEEVTEAKNQLVEQNKLLHSQLERAANQVRRSHEQELLKTSADKVSSANEGAEASASHAKEVDDLRSVVAFLRRESEISESKLEVSQQEVQRYRAQVFALESTVERLRQEIKTISANAATTSAGESSTDNTELTKPSDSAKRIAQLEQLNLLRESNATLRDENQKNLARLKEEEAKVHALEGKLAPLQTSETALKALIDNLKQELVTLTDANKRWKQRVDQLVEKYQQVDPAEHERVCTENETLKKEVVDIKAQHATLQAELETLRSSEGKALEEEKTKSENWSKQYDRIKGFAKNWKAKAESLTKQIAEKNKEIESKSAVVSELEGKLTKLESEKSALEAKIESSKQDTAGNAAAVASVTAVLEKERQELKERLDAEVKKSTQLKEFNARLMSGLKTLKKENSDLKDQVAAPAAAPAVDQSKDSDKVKEVAPALPSEPVPPVTATADSTPGGMEGTTTVVPTTFPPTTTAQATPVKPTETTNNASSTFVSTIVSEAGSQKTEAISVVSSTTSTTSSTTSSSTTAVSTVAPTALNASAASFTPSEVKETTDQPVSAEEKLRLFALQSLKKQVGGAARLGGTPSKPIGGAAAVKSTPPKLAGMDDSTSKVPAPSTSPFLNLPPPTCGGFAAFGSGATFGSGGASGLVFGKPGITLPIPSSPSPAVAPPVPSALESSVTATSPAAVTTTTAAPEAQRRSQRLARFAAAEAGLSSTPAVAAVTTNVLKRPSSDNAGAPTPQKMAKTGEDRSATGEASGEGKEEEETTTEAPSTPPTQAD